MWDVIGYSVRGATHERNGLPNQDALGQARVDGGGGRLMVAVSDGHSSERCFRSGIGAQLAVDAALAALREFDDSQNEDMPHAVRQQLACDTLPRSLDCRWTEAVQADVAARPFSAAEEDALVVGRGTRLAYGTTGLSVLLGDRFIVYMQVGDGDILVVTADGVVTRPIAADARHFANATTSLAATDAWRDVRIAYQPLEDTVPALMLLATDGYSNSFRTDADFLQVGRDLLDILREWGPDAVRADLPDWLRAATYEGSGDDVTAAIVYRRDAAVAPRAASTSEFLP